MAAISAAASAAVFTHSANAAVGTETWLGVSNNWNSGSNWSGPNLPPTAGDSLVFNLGSGGNVSNDLTAFNFLIGNITFGSSAGAYVISGNAFQVNSSSTFTNSTASTTETINDNINIAAGTTLTVAGGTAGFSFGGSIVGLGTSTNSTLSVTTGNATLTGLWSQTYFNVASGATLTLSGVGTNIGTGASNSSNIVLQGGTLNETGGYESSTDQFALGNTNSVGNIFNLTGGEFEQSGNNILLGQSSGGNGTININGTGLLRAYAGTTFYDGDNAVGTINLGNGTTGQGELDTYVGLTTNKAGSIFNFNGGLLRLYATSAGFFSTPANVTANVGAGGAIIDLNGFSTTIGTPLIATGNAANDFLTVQSTLGGGALTLTGANTIAGTTTIGGGATLNIGSAVGANSLNGTTGTALTFANSGSIVFNEATTGSSQGMGTLTVNAGAANITTTYGGGNNTVLTFSSMAALPSNATINFTTTNGNATTNQIVVTGSSAGIIGVNAFYDGATSAASYAVNNTAGGYVRGISWGSDANTSTVAGNTSLASIAYAQTTGNVTAQADATTFTGLNLKNAGNTTLAFTLAGNATVTTQGILTSGAPASGGGYIISGGNGITTGGSSPLVIYTATATDPLTINSSILSSTTGGLVKSGAGALTLGAANSFTGNITLNQGTLSVSNINQLGSNAVTLNGGNFTVTAAIVPTNTFVLAGGVFSTTLSGTNTPFTFSNTNQLTGSGPLILNYAGPTNAFVISAAQNYTGGTWLSNTAQLQVQNASALGTGDVHELNSGGEIDLNGGSGTITNNFFITGAGGNSLGILHNANNYTLGASPNSSTITIQSNGTSISNAGNGSYVINDAIYGPFSLLLDDTTGTSATTSVTLNGTSTFNGLTYAGIVNFSSDANLGALTGSVTSATPVAGQGATLQAGGNVTLNPGRGIVLGNTVSTTFDPQNFTLTVQGAITGANPLIINPSTGSGTVVFAGADSYTGNTTVSGGTLALTGSLTATPNIVTAGTGVVSESTTGVISGAANFTQNSSGTSVLAGANTYSGATVVSNGTLQAGVASVAGTSGAFGKNSAVTIGNVSGALLNLNNFSNQIGSLSGGGTLGGNITLGNATLTDVQTTTTSFAGAISGTGSLALNGSGKLVLYGNDSYSGGTFVSAGTLSFAQASAFPSTGTLTALNGTTVALNAGGPGEFTAANITSLLGQSVFNPTSTLAIDTTNSVGSFTYGGVINNAGGGNSTLALSKIGNGILVLTNTETYSGPTSVNVGTLALGTGGNLGNSTVTVGAGNTFAVQQTASGSSNTGGSALNLTGAGSSLNMIDGFTSTLSYTGAVLIGPASGNRSTISLDVQSNAGNTTVDEITSGSTIAVQGTGVVISFADANGNALQAGNYTLINATTAAGSNLGTPLISLASNTILVGNTTYDLSLAPSTGSQEILSIVAASAGNQAYWTGSQGNTWGANNAGNFNWNTSVNGSTNLGAAPSALTDVYFSTTIPTPGNLSTNLEASYTINSLNFLATSPSVTIGNNGNATNTLTIASLNSSANGINLAAGATNQIINANVILGSAQTWTNNSTAGQLSVNGTVAGSGYTLSTAGAGNISIAAISGNGTGLYVSGTGAVKLTGANTYSGPTTVLSGATLAVTGSLGSSTVTTNSGTLILAGGNGTTGSSLNNTTGSSLINNGTIQLQANGNNTSGGVSTALLPVGSTSELLTAGSVNSMTIQLRGDSSVAFSAGGSGGIAGINNGSGYTFNFDVNQLTSAGSGNTLTFAPAGGAGSGIIFGRNVTVNITGGNGYSLGLGEWSNVTTTGTLTFNPTSANVSVAGLSNNQGTTEIFALGGSALNNSVTGSITGNSSVNFTSSGSWTLGGNNTFGSTSTTPSAGSVNVTGTGTLSLANVRALGVTGGYVDINANSTLQLLTDTGFGANTYNLWYGNSNTGVGTLAETIALGRATAGASNSITQNFGTLTLAVNGGSAVTLNVVPGTNASSAQDTLAFTGLLTGNGNTVTHVLAPAGENITIGTVGTVTGTTAVTTIDLDGTSQGNAITGIIGSAGANLPADIAIVKSNSSTWTLGGNNTYTAGTILSAGTLNLNAATALGGSAGNFTIVGGGINNTTGSALVMTNTNPILLNGSFSFGSATSTAANNLTLPGAVTNATSGRVITLNGTGDTLNFSGLMTNTLAGANTITVNGAGNTMSFGSYALGGNATTSYQDVINGSANVAIPGVVSQGTATNDGLTYNGSGTLFLGGNNTFTGTLDITTGTVNVATLANYGTASSLGNRASASETGGAGDLIGLHFGSGTTNSGILQYTGSTAQSTNRQIRVAATTGSGIDASGTGSGTISFTESAVLTNEFDSGGARTFNLLGSNTGFNVFSIPMQDQAASTGLTSIAKSGVGTWAFNNTEVYGGATTVNGGRLVVGNGGGWGQAQATGAAEAGLASPVTVNSGGTLAVLPGLVGNITSVPGGNSTTNSLGIGNTTSGGTLTLNAGSAFTMAGDGIYSTFNVKGSGNSTLAPATGTSPTLSFDIGAGGIANVDKLAFTGNAASGAAKDIINVDYIGGTTAPTLGNYTLVSASGGLIAADFVLGTPKLTINGTTYTISLYNVGATTEGITIGNFTGLNQAYWLGGVSTSWTTPGNGTTNWSSSPTGSPNAGAIPGASTDVFFSAAGASNLTTNVVDGNITINTLNFVAGGNATTIGSTGNNTLTINAGLTNLATTAQIINAPIALGASQTWANTGTLLQDNGSINNAGYTLTTSGNGSFALGGNISGAGGLTVAGTGKVILTGANNSYSGATTVRGGVLAIGGNLSGTNGFDVGSASGPVVALTSGNITIGNGTGNRIGWGQAINSPSIGTEYVNGATVSGNSDTTIGWVSSTGASATGNFFLTSGSFTQSTGSFYAGVTTSLGTATGTASVSGGTFTSPSTLIGGGGGAFNAHGTFNVNGGTVSLGTVNTANAGLATLNIGPSASVTTGNWTTGAANTFINFNGGTLVSGGGAGTTFGTAALVLYGNGGTINANGNATTISGTISNATGSGVTALAVTGNDTSTVFNAPPNLVFTGGGGSGASGYATLNGNGTISGYVITNAGTGYTSAPSVSIAGSTETYSSTLTSNVNAPLNIQASGTTVTVSGTNTPTGQIIVQSGTVKNGAAGAFGPVGGPGVNVQSGATLDMNGLVINGAVTLAGTGVGGTAGALTNSGAGLSSTSISNLTLAGNALIVPINRLEQRSGSTYAPFNMNGYTLTISGGNNSTGFHLTGGTGVNILNPGNITVSGNGTDFAPELATNFNGTAANVLTLGNGTLLGTYALTGTTPWTINATNASIANYNSTSTWNGPVVLTGNVTTINSGGNLVFNGAISGNGSLVATSASGGSLTIAGNDSYLGGTVINGGVSALTVNATGSSALGATSAPLTVNNSNTTAAGDAVILNLSTTAPTTVGTLSGTISSPTSGTNTATINLGGQIFTVNQAGNGTYGGVIAGGGGIALGSSSNGTLILSGVNTFGGGVAINNGILQLGSTGALNSTSGSENAVSFGAGTTTGTLALGGNSVVISNLNSNATPGSPIVENANGALISNAILTVGNSQNLSGSYAGVLQNGSGGGTLGLTKSGLGTLTLLGSSTYTGATTVSAGTLTLGQGGGLGNTAVTVINIATLAVQQAAGSASTTLTAGSLTLNSGSNLTMVDGFATTANVGGNANFNGATLTFDLTGGNGSVSTDQLAIGGTASVTGTNFININSATLTGNPDPNGPSGTTYTLINASGGNLTGTFSLASSPIIYVGAVGYPVSLINASTFEELQVGQALGSPYSLFWSGGQDGNWSTNNGNATNWNTDATSNINSGNTSNPLPTQLATINFSTSQSVLPNAQNLSNNNLDGNYTINGLNFTSDAQPVTISTNNGSILTVNGGGITNASSSTQTINVPVVIGAIQTWSSTSNGTLVVAGDVNNQGIALTTATTAGGGNISISGNISGGGNLNATGSGTLAISGGISGSGNILASGNGAVVLSGANGNFTGSTSLTGGTLQLIANGSNISGGNATVIYDGVINTVASGTTLKLNSDTSVNFTGGNNLAGLTNGNFTFNVDNVSSGANQTISFAPAGFTTTNETINVTGGDGYSLQLGGGSMGNGTTTFNTTTANLIEGALSNGTLIKTGTGVLTLAASNSYTGTATISAGTLAFSGPGNSPSMGVITIGANGTLQLQANGSNVTGSTSNVLGFTGGGNTSNGGVIFNSGATIQLLSDNNVTFAGTNGLGGLNNQTLNFNVGALTGNGTAGAVLGYALGGNQYGSSITINVTSSNGDTLALGNMNNVTGSGTFTLNPTTGNLSVAGFSSTDSTTSTETLALSGTSGNNTVGPITNGTAASVQPYAVTKSGNSTWTMTGNSTYTGSTTVNAGTLNFAGTNTAATVGAISVNAGILNIQTGSYNTGGNTFVVGDAAGGGTVNQSGGTVTIVGGTALIVGNDVSTNSYAGAYNLSGGNLTMTGLANSRGVILGTNAGANGTFTLSGTGNLSISGGILEIGRSDSTGCPNTTDSFTESGGTAVVSNLSMGGYPGQANDNVNATLYISGGTFSAGTITAFSAAQNDVSTITITGNAAVTLPAFPTARGTGATATITFDSSTGGFLSPAGNSTVYMPAGTFNNAYLTTNGANFNVPGNVSITVGQVLQDQTSLGNLTKSGLGTLALSGANLYTGTTAINAGTLQIGGGSTTGSLATASPIVDNATLAFNLTNTITQGSGFASTISGTGGVTQAGSGVVVLNGNNTYQGPTTVNAGFLQISAANNIGNSGTNNTVTLGGGTLESTANTYDLGANRNITLTGNSTVQADAGTLSISGNVTNGANNLTFAGAGSIIVNGVIGTGATPTGGLNIGTGAASTTVTLNGNNSFTGGVSLVGSNVQPDSILILTNSGSLGVGPKTVTSTGGGEIHLQGNISFASNISFTTSGSSQENGNGSVNHGVIINDSGNNTINGVITMTSNDGNSIFASNSGLLTLAGNITSNVTLRSAQFQGAGNGLVSGTILNGSGNNTVSVVVNGPGTWTFSGPNSYSNGASVKGGTAIAAVSTSGSTGAFGSTSVAVALGNTSGNASASILTGGAFTVSNPINAVATNAGNTTLLTIGGNTDTNSTFSGPITLNNNLTVSQVANTGSNALSITGGITGGSGNNTVTFAGPGNISVSSNAITNGSGTTAVAVTGGATTFASVIANPYSGGTTVSGNGATLLLVNVAGGALSGAGQIQGSLTINSGGTVNAGTGWALGYSTGNVNYIAINGGTLQFATNAMAGGTSAGNITMAGGTISATAGTGFDLYNQAGAYNPAITVNSGSGASTISANMNLRLGSNSSYVTFNVAGTTDTPELVVSGNIGNSGGSDGYGSIVKTGAGEMDLNGVNSYSGTTSVQGGTLRTTNLSGPLVVGTGSAGSGTIAVGPDATTAGTLASANGVTFNNGGAYAWKITSIGTGNATVGSGASGTIGGGSGQEGQSGSWDLLNVTSGVLDLSGLTSAQPFTIAPSGNITSGTQGYSWVIAQAPAGGINMPGGYAPPGANPSADLTNGGSGGAFVLNTSGLTDASNPNLAPSEFSLEAVNFSGHEDLVLDYAGSPEPGTTILVLGGAVPMLMSRRLRRQKGHVN